MGTMKHFKRGVPWLTKTAIKYLRENLKKTDKILEFGAGGSTIFFAEYVQKVISVETSLEWIKCVKERLVKEKLNNVDILFLERDPASFVAQFPDNEFDWVLVDSRRWRRTFINHSRSKLKSNGYMIVDNYARPEYQKAIKPCLLDWQRFFCDNSRWKGKGTAFYRKP